MSLFRVSVYLELVSKCNSIVTRLSVDYILAPNRLSFVSSCRLLKHKTKVYPICLIQKQKEGHCSGQKNKKRATTANVCVGNSVFRLITSSHDFNMQQQQAQILNNHSQLGRLRSYCRNRYCSSIFWQQML